MDIAAQTAKAKAGKGKDGGKNGGKNGKAGPRGLLRAHLQARHGAALGRAQGHHPRRAEDGLRAGDLAFQGCQAAGRRGRRRSSPPRKRRGACWCWKIRKLRGQSRITQSLYAGLQLILPGEIAPPHRHAACGDPLHPRRRGRLHPGRRREDHHVAGRLRAHAVLDHPRSRQHFEEVDDLARRARRADGQLLRDLLLRALRLREAEHPARRRGLARRATARACCRTASTHANNSPIVNYPYAKMRPILERLARAGDIDPRHGARFRYANPLTGGR